MPSDLKSRRTTLVIMDHLERIQYETQVEADKRELILQISRGGKPFVWGMNETLYLGHRWIPVDMGDYVQVNLNVNRRPHYTPRRSAPARSPWKERCCPPVGLTRWPRRTLLPVSHLDPTKPTPIQYDYEALRDERWSRP